MSDDQLNPELLTVNGLFDKQACYTVPVYQRNYAWRVEQIEQLISDLRDAMSNGNGQGYFLGNLIVQRISHASENSFEVVDGQQRLTTLYLLLTYLEKEGVSPRPQHKGRLQYESRARATEALRRIGKEASMPDGQTQDSTTSEDSGIHEGFNIIQQMFQQHEALRRQEERCKFADFLRTKVTVVRASLPPKTDLNRYFEIMNTRGQQLKQVDIVKARLMSALPDSDHSGFAWIWDACADMDSYVQMPLTRGNTKLRDDIFGADWSWLRATDFQTLLNARQLLPGMNASTEAATALPLDEALRKYARTPQQDSGADEGSERFRSTIEFPVLLLHVLKVTKGDAAEDEGQLDDKRLIHSFTEVIKATPQDHRADWVRNFAFTLLKCRNFSDSFVLKRQFVTRTEDPEGDWSLRRLKKMGTNNKPTPGYIHVFSKTEQQTEEDADTDTRNVLLLQSMLRITYTAPRNMHWITKILQWLVAIQNPSAVTSTDLSNLLSDYARSKVAENFSFVESEQPTDFEIGRIVFTYLDYLLVKEAPTMNFKFQFRNSIEHFYPQHPNKEQSGASVSSKNLKCLGNLALVSVSANSKFSDNLPKVKADNFRDTIEVQSPKLQRMAEITRSEGWGDEQITAHHKKMVNLLEGDIKKNSCSLLSQKP